MTRLRWAEVADLFVTEYGGVLPDVTVPDASVADWQTVLDLVVARWPHEYQEDGVLAPIVPARTAFARAEQATPCVRVWPVPEILVIFRFWSPDEVTFDVDLRELQGQQRLDALCGFFEAIGRRLGKPVVMTFEGTGEHPMIGYDAGLDRVVRLAD